MSRHLEVVPTDDVDLLALLGDDPEVPDAEILADRGKVDPAAGWADVPGLTAVHAAECEAQAITPAIAARMGVRSATTRGRTGMIFPYRARDGRVLDIYRLSDAERAKDPKGRKYAFPAGKTPPLSMITEAGGGGPVLLVEGTRQGLAVGSWAPQGYAVYGMNGCRGWAKNDLTFAAGRTVFVLFDVDMRTNGDVYDAAAKLAGELTVAGAAGVRFVYVPGSAKDGIDDVLGRTDPAQRTPMLARLLDGATGELGPHPDVRRELDRMRTLDAARRLFDAERRPPRPLAATVALAELLGRPDVAVRFRIGGLWPTGGKVLLTAPKKAGKTTLVGNLVRCLADGARFLRDPRPGRPGRELLAELDPDQFGGFDVAPICEGRRLVLLDFEMTEQQLKDWLRDQQIRSPERVHVQLLRGRGPWDIRDDEVRAEWAARLREVGTDVLLVDPLGPILHALGINENDNSEVGHFLGCLDRLCAEAGVGELFVAHHTGHEGERSRGASSLLGWGDATWSMTRDGDNRFLGAEGRDVAVGERVLTFDASTRRLGFGSLGGRSDLRESAHALVVMTLVGKDPGCSTRTLREALMGELKIGKTQAEDAIGKAVGSGRVHVHPGANRTHHHHPGSACEGGCP